MNVSGKILVKGSATGIPNLLVTVYDADASVMPSSNLLSCDCGELNWDRLGSIVTDANGKFDIPYGDDGETDHSRRRPNLVLVVSKAEENGAPGQERISSLAIVVRRKAASAERFLIALEHAQLTSAGISSPEEDQDIENILAQRRATAQREEKVRAGSQRLFVERLGTQRNFARLAEPKFETFLAALSGVSDDRRSLSGSRYVRRDTSVAVANREVIESAIRERINQATVTTFVALTDEQVMQFKDDRGQYVPEIPPEKIEGVIRPAKVGKGPSRYRYTPPGVLCREDVPVDPCVEILEGKDPAAYAHNGQQEIPEPAPTDLGKDAKGITATDIPVLIENLMKDVTPPESTTIFGVKKRAEVGDVYNGVKGFTLESGPADAPSLHDFHHLQIAFEHIWQEIFDNNVLNNGLKLYTTLVGWGIDPNEYWIKPGEFVNVMKNIISTAAGGETTDSDDNLREVIKAFDITPQQWAQLTESQQTDLATLAKNLNAVLSKDYFNAENNAWYIWAKENQNNYRHQGECIINYANKKLNASQTFEQYHKIIKME